MTASSFQHDIFLSYAREDRERVKLLANTLSSLGWSVWWDRRIPTGKRFAKVIEEQLDSSRIIVVVWSTTSIQSDWVHTEAAEGLRRAVLFPIQIDAVTIPLEFRRVQAADLIHWQGDPQDDHWQKLVHDLASVLGQPIPISPPAEQKEQEETRQKRVKPPQPKKAKTTTTEPQRQTTRQTPEGMVLIPKGKFLYGDEKQKVIIDHDYYIDVNPVTNAAYQKFIEAGGYHNQSYWSQEGWKCRREKGIRDSEDWNNKNFNQPDQPVVGVGYYEAEAYAKWVGKRLPTEQEWEKAARGTDGREYPWGAEFDASRCASSVEKKRDRTELVGNYLEGQSPFGCQDLVGNVWEWCANWYDEDTVTKVLRGGSWGVASPEKFRCAFRGYDGPWFRNFDIGFRCAKDAP